MFSESSNIMKSTYINYIATPCYFCVTSTKQSKMAQFLTLKIKSRKEQGKRQSS